MRIIIRTNTSQEDCFCDCDYAVVDVTPELIARIRRLVEAALAARGASEAIAGQPIIEARFSGDDGVCRYFGESLVTLCQELWGDDDNERLMDDGYAMLPDGIDLDKCEETRTECHETIVGFRWVKGGFDPEVSWFCLPKHSDVHITAAPFTIEDLEGVLAQAANQ